MGRSLLAGAAILISCSLSAMAADMAVKAPPPSPAPAAAPAVDWTGFYIGGHAGAATSVMDNIVDVDGLNGGAHYQINDTTAIAGGQAGYNFQWSYFVVGVEGDFSSIYLNDKKFDPNFPTGTFSTLNGSFLYDVTGRAGLAYNGLFVYFKGGEAWTNIVASVDNHLGGFGGGRAYTGDFNGPIYGGGAEWFVFPNWSVKAEYQRIDLGTQNAVLRTPANGTFRYSNSLGGINMWTVGLNYHFFSWPIIH
jgi:outer membrane immunogenic protein